MLKVSLEIPYNVTQLFLLYTFWLFITNTVCVMFCNNLTIKLTLIKVIKANILRTLIGRGLSLPTSSYRRIAR